MAGAGTPSFPAEPDSVVVRSWWLMTNYRLHLWGVLRRSKVIHSVGA
jgi:hypothetical protein